MPTPVEPEGPPGIAFTVASYAVVVVLAVVLALWGAFLVPLRIGSVPVPVSWAVALVGGALVCGLGARLVGSLGAAAAGLAWVGTAVVLGIQRTEGDLVVSGSVMGVGFLLLSALVCAGSFGVLSRATPGAPASR